MAPAARSHLVVFVNGMWGCSKDWKHVIQALKADVYFENALLHVSTANQRHDTFHGVDVCGHRLASEVQDITACNPQLSSISFIGHSFGGLITRYAIGILYDFQTRKVAGLEPRHLITMATPHLGTSASAGPAQLPVVVKISDLHIVPKKFVQNVATIYGWTRIGRSGHQLFWAEEESAPAPGTILNNILAVDDCQNSWTGRATSYTQSTAPPAKGTFQARWSGSWGQSWLRGNRGGSATDAVRAQATLAQHVQQHSNSFAVATSPASAPTQISVQNTPIGNSAETLLQHEQSAKAGVEDAQAAQGQSLLLQSHPEAADVMQAGVPVSTEVPVQGQFADAGIDSVHLHADRTAVIREASLVSTAGGSTVQQADAKSGMEGGTAGVQPGNVQQHSQAGVQQDVAGQHLGLEKLGQEELREADQNVEDVGEAKGGEAKEEGEQLPMLAFMLVDWPQKGLYFYSALASFASRTCYANSDCDHLVAWENCSVRNKELLPPHPSRQQLLASPGSCIWNQESLESAFWTHGDARDRVVADNDVMAALLSDGPEQLHMWMLQRLQQLPWRRVDVSFRLSLLGSAHCNLQYNRWINYAGKPVVAHMVDQLKAMDAVVGGQQTLHSSEVSGPEHGMVTLEQAQGVPAVAGAAGVGTGIGGAAAAAGEAGEKL